MVEVREKPPNHTTHKPWGSGIPDESIQRNGLQISWTVILDTKTRTPNHKLAVTIRHLIWFGGEIDPNPVQWVLLKNVICCPAYDNHILLLVFILWPKFGALWNFLLHRLYRNSTELKLGSAVCWIIIIIIPKLFSWPTPHHLQG